MQRTAIGRALAGSMAAMFAGQADGQTIGGTSGPVVNEVLARPRPGLEPTGIHVGGATVFPQITATLGYDDNVFADNAFRRSSWFAVLEPKVSVRSNWPVHLIDIEASGTFQRYPDVPRNDFDQYGIAGTGRLDIARNAALTLDAHFQHGVEPRGTAGDILIDGGPTTFQSYGAAARANVALGNLALEAGIDVGKLTYGEVRNGTTTISLSYRNRVQLSAHGRAGLAIGPGLTAFVDGAYDRQDYDLHVPSSWNSSTGWRVLSGVEFRVTRLIGGRIGIGYLRRSYGSPAFLPVSGLDYSAQVTWNVTPLVTLTAEAVKAIDESPRIGVSGIVRNQAEIAADYELLRRLLVHPNFTYITERYRWVDRLDHRAEGGIGFRYLANRFVEFGLRAEHRGQSSWGPFGRQFSESLITISLTVQR